jgi:GT2 family glycosyltransferase
MAAPEARPLVSVVVPTFNRPEVTAQAVASVLAQTFKRFELIVVDDASQIPFDLPGKLRDPRVRILRHPVNRGAAGARNSGVSEARGDWVAFLDSDDLWLPDKLERQIAAAATAGDMAAWACGFTKIDAFDSSRVDQIPIEATQPRLFASGCWFCPGTTALVSKMAFERVGPFDETLRRLEDLDWYVRFAVAGGSLRVVPNVLCTVQIGGRPNAPVVDTAVERILKKEAAGAYGENSAIFRRQLRAYLALEQAAATWNQRPRHMRHGVLTAWHLLRSLAFTPRLRLHLADFWRMP